MMPRQVEGKQTTDRAAHEDRTVESESPGQRHRQRSGKGCSEAIFFRPPFRADWRQRLAVKRQIVGDQAEMIGDFPTFEEMSPLRTMSAGRVLQQHRNAGARLLKVNAVVLAFNLEVNVASDGTVECTGGLGGGQTRLSQR